MKYGTLLRIMLGLLIAFSLPAGYAQALYEETIDVYDYSIGGTITWAHTYDGSEDPITSATLTIVADDVDDDEDDAVYFNGHFLGNLNDQGYYSNWGYTPGPGAGGDSALTTTVFVLDTSWITPGMPAYVDVEDTWGCEVETATLSVEGDPDLDGDGSPASEDCDDNDSSVYPGAPQLCDGKNNDCDSPIWPTTPADEVDLDGDGYMGCEGDCNDLDASINPDAYELPGNAVDENCDGSLGACDPGAEWKNHGQFVRCVAHETDALIDAGVLTQEEGDVLISTAAQSEVGKK